MKKNGRHTQILIATRHALFREGLRDLMECQEDFRVVGEAEDVAKAVHLSRLMKPDLLILDSDLLEMPGDELLSASSRLPGGILLVLLTDEIQPARIAAALQAGFSGVVSRDLPAETLFECLRAVSRGNVWAGKEAVATREIALKSLERARITKSPPGFGLTRRELEIVSSVVSGKTNKEISSLLGISEDTVKHHLSNIFDKVGVYNRLELALFSVHHGLLGKILMLANGQKAAASDREDAYLIG